MSIKGIDVSEWNGLVDYNAVKKAGYEFVIIRIGYGRVNTQKDSFFEKNYKEAKAADLKVGVYHYNYAKTVENARLEAQVCLEWLAERPLDLGVYYDMEENNTAACGKSTCTAMATAFCDIIKAAGYKAGVYSNPNWFENYLDYKALKAKYSIWLAEWSSSKSYDCDIWQNSSSGKVNGINGNVDTNYCYLDFGSTSKPITAATSSSTYSNRVLQFQIAATKDGYKFDAYGCDGIYGEETREIMTAAIIKKGSKGNLVKLAQQLLINHGYKPNGGTDGIFGISTEEKTKIFQKNNALTIDGIIGINTWTYLLHIQNMV